MGRYITSVIFVCMNILMLLVITGQTNQQVSSPKTISSWIQQNHHHHHYQPSSINHRSIRSVKWEWSIDALKCSLKMMSLQISRKLRYITTMGNFISFEIIKNRLQFEFQSTTHKRTHTNYIISEHALTFLCSFLSFSFFCPVWVSVSCRKC